MKTSLAVLAVGLLGMLFGSLSAQQPDDEHFGMQQGSVIYEGNADVLVEGEDVVRAVTRGHVRVHDGWVVIEGDRVLPRERIREIILNPDRRRDEFGDQPGADPNAVPDSNPDTPPKRRPFRED